MPTWLRKVGQPTSVVLPGDVHLLSRRLVLHFRQNDVRRDRLVGLEPLLERRDQLLVRVRQVAGDAEPFPAIGGRLEEAIRLHECEQLGLNDGPLLLVERGLGDLVAVGRLMTELDRLADRDQEIVLPVVIERAGRMLRSCSPCCC